MRESKDLRPLSKEVIKRRLVLFAGKGGVGKTVFACALGIHLARKGRKTLVYSVDPAHSLSDCFHVEVCNKITRISDNLYGLEIDAKQLLHEIKKKYVKATSQSFRFFARGIDLPFERELMADMMDLSPPGIDELMSLTKLTDLVKTSDYDSIIINMAAGLHAIRLLELPQAFENWLSKMLGLLDQYGNFMRVEDLREFAQTLNKDLDTLKTILATGSQSLLIPVMTTETLAISVAKDIIEAVRPINIPDGHLIVNQLIPSDSNCAFCEALRNEQKKGLAEIRKEFRNFQIITVPLFPHPIDGLESLSHLAGVFSDETLKFTPSKPAKQTATQQAFLKLSKLTLPRDLNVIIFGGKGGCGKTTCSAATGVYMAEKNSRTLVFSSDPQRSLSLVFDQDIAGEISEIKDVKNLYALQIDSGRLLNDFKQMNREEILEIVSSATYLRREDVMAFLELSLPGMDEVMGLIKLVDILSSNQYDLIVLDTAPTGHAMRLLEMPDLLASWGRLLFKMRSKARYIEEVLIGGARKTRADLFLEKLLKDVRRIRSVLKDSQTVFLPVAIPEEMALGETERLVSFLNNYGLNMKAIVMNKVIVPNANCNYCTSKSEAQLSRIGNLNRKLYGQQIIGVPILPHEVRGAKELKKFAKLLYGSS